MVHLINKREALSIATGKATPVGDNDVVVAATGFSFLIEVMSIFSRDNAARKYHCREHD
jgi:hypothetical protein